MTDSPQATGVDVPDQLQLRHVTHPHSPPWAQWRVRLAVQPVPLVREVVRVRIGHLRLGRIVISELEAPNMFMNLVWIA
jgi:hypothetical protein